MRPTEFTRDRFQEAVRLYLEEAYPDGAVPAAVAVRLKWPPGGSLAEVARGEMFERVPPRAEPDACARIRLRLGNRVYPHMKIGLDRVPDTGEWVLAVDSHDGMLLEAAGDEEREAVEVLIRRNAEIKTRIERRWNEAGLPTFERFVRERLRRKASGPEAEREETT